MCNTFAKQMGDVRLDGGGYELGVFRQETGKLVVALPVSSSFLTSSFEFEISENIAEALINDPDLRTRLDKRLHSMLQGRITRGGQGASDEECLQVIHEMVS